MSEIGIMLTNPRLVYDTELEPHNFIFGTNGIYGISWYLN